MKLSLMVRRLKLLRKLNQPTYFGFQYVQLLERVHSIQEQRNASSYKEESSNQNQFYSEEAFQAAKREISQRRVVKGGKTVSI